jgi:uncharacterized NAD(P)/FAD-binding protein YdhS
LNSDAMPRRPERRPIAVIGAGFSGTIAVLHLLRRLPADQPVLLCERAPEFGRGLAYAGANEHHLLNVRAANMSALADEPNHFAAWLATLPEANRSAFATQAGLFATRGVYGEYLQSLLATVLRESAGEARLRLMPDEATDAVPLPEGGFTLGFAGGIDIDVAGIVLASGNLQPEEHPDPRICTHPWGEKAARPLAGQMPVLIVGTGLTMVDLAVSIRRRGFTGPLLALSRGGLLPARHEPALPWQAPTLTPAELSSLPLLMQRLRHEIRIAAAHGVDWRAVVDSLRPATVHIWAGLPVRERDRFLRHARRYWDVHRHRMAPPHADIIDAMVSDGSLQIAAGRIEHMEPEKVGIEVHCRVRGGAKAQVLHAQRVIMAHGLIPIAATRDKLVSSLVSQGLARLDAHALGLDVTDALQLRHADGTPDARLWALGPIVRGVFWECVAVPDIRNQAAHLAASVAAGLQHEAHNARTLEAAHGLAIAHPGATS